MRKLLSLALALAMCACLAACGGGDNDTTPAGSDPSANSAASAEPSDNDTAGGPTEAQLEALTEAYNEVAVLYNDVATTAQENGWTADEETNAKIQAISAMLDPVGAGLSGDMSYLEGADFDELPKALLELKPDLEELAAKVAEPYSGDGAVVTDEALKPLANAYNELATIFNEVYPVAEANGWLDDEQTSAELDAVYGMVSFVGSGLSDDPSKLDSIEDMDGLVEQLQQFVPALEEIGQRVSVPYEG